MKKYDVGFNTETFRHYGVEAKTPDEAQQKAWDLYTSGNEPNEPDDTEEGVSFHTGTIEIKETPHA